MPLALRLLCIAILLLAALGPPGMLLYFLYEISAWAMLGGVALIVWIVTWFWRLPRSTQARQDASGDGGGYAAIPDTGSFQAGGSDSGSCDSGGGGDGGDGGGGGCD